jgi:hypothetical protein
MIKVKVKCTLLQTLRLCIGHVAHRGSRGIALPFLEHGTRRGWGVSVTLRLLFTPGKDLVPIVQKAGWAPGPVWTGVENLAPFRIRSPDRPARSQSLNRLCYPVHGVMIDDSIFFKMNSHIQWRWMHSYTLCVTVTEVLQFRSPKCSEPTARDIYFVQFFIENIVTEVWRKHIIIESSGSKYSKSIFNHSNYGLYWPGLCCIPSDCPVVLIPILLPNLQL